MTNNIYFLAIYLNELHLWLKIGLKRISKNKLIKAHRTKKGEFSSKENLTTKIIQNVPEYDDDFEILIVELPEKEIAELMKGSSDFFLKFESIDKVYPVSHRAKLTLKSKIDDRIILEDPIFDKIFNELARQKEKDLGLRGAITLLTIFDLGNFENELLSFNDYLDEALILRQSNIEKISNNRHYLVNLMLYDRSKPFPNNDLGFFYDLGSLLRIYEKNKPATSQTLREYNDVLEKFKNNLEYRNFESMIKELHDSEMIDKLNNIIDENIVVTSFIFLLLRSDIRESNDLEHTRIFDIISSEYLNLYYKREIACALWLIGYFFGFEMIADLYYKKIKSRVLTFATPFPEIKKLTISIDNVQRDVIEDIAGHQAIVQEKVEFNTTLIRNKELENVKPVNEDSEIIESESLKQETLESEKGDNAQESITSGFENIEPQNNETEKLEADSQETKINVEPTTIKNKPKQKKSKSKQNSEPDLGLNN